jgi:hypothetical protein
VCPEVLKFLKCAVKSVVKCAVKCPEVSRKNCTVKVFREREVVKCAVRKSAVKRESVP